MYIRLLPSTILAALLAVPAFAQQQPMSDAQAAATCSACGGAFFLIIIAAIAINIAILVWVARDAKARGSDSAALWMIFVFFTGVIGLIVYVLARPQGNMVQCPHCNNKKLQMLAKCPHCGNAIGSPTSI